MASKNLCARAVHRSNVDSRCGGLLEVDVTKLLQSVSKVPKDCAVVRGR
jgi:hypothetical protein